MHQESICARTPAGTIPKQVLRRGFVGESLIHAQEISTAGKIKLPCRVDLFCPARQFSWAASLYRKNLLL